ncbi:hypothetical protein GQ44DRAFT_712861 [Phaeosphaeriaceae sp. PMI808]|nr:hypothetical protein GQ44DRAFT_712861 [Phaeosphaeriaceae sp. PMI808]
MDHSKPLVKDEENDEDHALDDESDDFESYKPRPSLPKPIVVMRSLAHLMKDLDLGRIDVDPDYQREVVWTADGMTGLINSLMENYYIPPIILNRKTSITQPNGELGVVHICVDGKQRLSSVKAFIKGVIPCHDHRGEKWWFCDASTTRRKKVLSRDTQKLFLMKEFVSFEFKDLSPEQEEDLFARVQMGVRLSPAEKMRASTGPWQELAKLFVDDFPTVYSLMKDTARAKDFQLTLSCFHQILEVRYPTASNGVPILKTNHAALPKLLSNRGALDDVTKSHLASIWNIFTDLIEQDPDIFTNSNKYLRGVQTFAPIEMVTVTIIISMYSEKRNNQLLLGDIKAFRESIREHFADLRMNSSVWKYIWDYLDNMEAVRGAVDGSTFRGGNKIPIANEPEKAPPSPTVLSSTSTTPLGVVRARPRAGAIKKPVTILPSPSMIKKEESLPITRQIHQPKRKRLNSRSPSLEFDQSVIASLHRIPSKTNSPSPAGIGAYAPHYTNQQWAGEIRSSPAQEEIVPSAIPPQNCVARKAGRKGRNSTLKITPSPPPPDEVVDLTSDTEQERQDLLASFKITAFAPN